MAPVVEVVTFIASEAYMKDRSVAHPGLELLHSVQGCVGIWHGVQIQDPSFGYLVVLWETLEHHLAYMNNKEEYPKLGAAMQPVSDKRLGLYHARHPKDITPALEAPATEFVVWSLREGMDRDVYQATEKRLVDTFYSDLADEFLGGGLGEIVEDQRKFSVILGWYSVERFNASVFGNPKCAGILEELKKLAEPDLKHANLEKFKKN